MIDKLVFILKMLSAILPFVALCVSSAKVNLAKSERSKQFFMPVIALIYTVAAMFLSNRINQWLITFLNHIPVWIASLANVSWMPEKIAPLLLQLSEWIRSFLAGLTLDFWVFFIANTIIILVYLSLKKACIKIMSSAVKSDGELHEKVAGIFYEFFIERGIWCLKDSYVQARSLLKLFYYTAVSLSTGLMLSSYRFYTEHLFRAMYYPVFGIIILGELYFYLDGVTKREYSSDILGEDEDAYRNVNYSLLRKYLRSVFGDKLLSENTSVNNALANDITTDEIIHRLESSEDQKIVTFSEYIRALNATGVKIDHNYLYSSLKMLDGESILFNNPFYNDLVPYAFYPMNRCLLSHQKVLVVLGRHAIEQDIRQWLEKGIAAVTNIPTMWNIGILTREATNPDIGIVTRSDVLDIRLHEANAEFLKDVGFFVIIEPSKLISTAQIGLNMLVKKCRTDEDKNIVYCLCDKNCDGLVDAMSHILMTSITQVSATEKHTGTSSYMCWEADGEYLHHRLLPNISRYLGLGTELSFAALKNQVSKTEWYAGEAFPVTDIQWIDKQYYYDLTKFAGLPTGQEAIDEYFSTTPNFWSAQVKKNNYITVEDEAYNMFEILRNFSTRTSEQGFINVISSEYLMKDYMADNAPIFEADAKAVPYIVADYTRSNRNTILRLILMMSTFPVNEKVLKKELSLLGVHVFDLKKQLWYELFICYSPVAKIIRLPEDYEQAVNAVYYESINFGVMQWNHDLIEVSEAFSLETGEMETMYHISDSEFLTHCVSELRSAEYIAEDEKGNSYYLGAELSGHIYQKYLPGQFFTFAGKYYQMQYLTADGQILLRRAADHINGRPSYRQIREYTIRGIKPSEKIGARRNIEGLRVVKEFADIRVKTDGYYRMEKYNDFETAKRVCFEGETGTIPDRNYYNKEILRIELPDLGGKLNDNIRYTVTVLFNEVFRTLFAENQAYICAVTDDSFLRAGEDRIFTYTINADGCELDKNSIYIIEDSQLDLGLTVAVERNLQRIFCIIHDYLDWHAKTLEDSLNPPVEPEPNIVFEPQEDDAKKKKGIKAFFAAIGQKIKKAFDKFKGLFRRRRKKKDEPTAEDPIVQPPEKPEEPPVTPETPEKPVVPENPEIPDIPQTPDDDGEPEKTAKAEESADGPMPASAEDSEENSDAEDEDRPGVGKETASAVESPMQSPVMDSQELEKAVTEGFASRKKPYHERYYMLYGRQSEPSYIDLSGALAYLSEMGLDYNALKQAREGRKIAEKVEATFKPGKPDARYCDFCGAEIYGVEYETLSDGRDRCIGCSRTAVKTEEEFRKLFEDVKRNMESFFGIRINVGIKVEMVNARTLHKRLGKAYIPTPESDGRVLGVAIKDKNGYKLYVENGSPRMSSMLTIVHELTHIWQYLNWNDKAIRKLYGKKLRLEVYEGMAKWVEIQYAYLINEPAVAKREEIITSYRSDEYGRGFLRYLANYPFSTGTVITKPTPFLNPQRPLDPQYCGSCPVIIRNPGGGRTEPEDDDTPTGGGKTPTGTDPIKGPVERNPDAYARYAYDRLNDAEKAAYDLVLQAVNGFTEQIDLSQAAVTDSQIRKIVDFVQCDHPEIFWFQHGATFYFDPNTHIVSRLELQFCMTPQEAEKRRGEIDAHIRSFMSSIHDNMSDYEVALRIYENIIKLVDYDTIGLEKQKSTTVSAEIPDDLRSVYGVFVQKKAVCAGYAKAMQYLLNRCGIESTYVTSSTHAWNLIKLEGDYYHLDVTWGDGSDTKKDKVQTDAVNYDCFCLTTEEVLRLESHTPEADFPVPVCTATKCNYHVRQGLYFNEYNFDAIRSVVGQSVRQNKYDITIKFGSASAYASAKKQLLDGGKFREIIQYVNLKPESRIGSSYSYSVRDELYTIAFYMNKL